MSNIKPEAIESMSAIPDQSSSTSIIKSESTSPPQPLPAAFMCEYCGKKFNLRTNMICHVDEIHGDTCMPIKPEPYTAGSVTIESLSYLIPGERNSSTINTDILQSDYGTPDRQRLRYIGIAEKRQNSNISHEGIAEKKLLYKDAGRQSGAKHFNCDM
eukprot:371387_1